MAEGFVQKAGWQAFSAGIIPESEVNPYAVKVMAEIGLDISQNHPKSACRCTTSPIEATLASLASAAPLSCSSATAFSLILSFYPVLLTLKVPDND